MYKLGVLQGRLSEPVNGHIQEFPFDNWKKEFDLLKELKLNHIEWLVTKNSFENNPLFNNDLKEYSISSICCDHIIDDFILYPWFLEKYLTPVCEASIKNNIKNITIPLLEQSNMEIDGKRKVFCNSIIKYGVKYKDKLNFTFEMELHPLKQLEIVNLSDNFYITYDTGNITSCGFDHKYCLCYLHNKINNLHLKERKFNKETVEPGTGNTNFELIFNLLKEYKYDGYYTIQSARGLNADEFNTIYKHKNYFLKFLINE